MTSELYIKIYSNGYSGKPVIAWYMIRIIDGIFLFIARINNYIHYKVRDWLSILSQFQQFSGWLLGMDK